MTYHTFLHFDPLAMGALLVPVGVVPLIVAASKYLRQWFR
jgi:hypothetical protein